MTSATPRTTRAAYPRWGLVDVVAGIVAFLLLSAAAQELARVPAVAAQPQLRFVIDQVVVGWLPILAAVIVASRWRGRGSLSADFGLRFRALDVAIGVLGGILLRFAAVGIAELTRLAAGAPATPFAGGVGADPVWFVLTAVVAASVVTPVVEELFFRGLVLRSIHNAVLGGPSRSRARDYDPQPAPDAPRNRRATAGVLAVAGSALLFVAFHLDGVPDSAAAVSRLITLLVVGLVLGALALLTGRLGPSITTHAVFNLSVAVLDLLATTPSAPTLG
ncbi:CPBP family intramembrane glutamic endopeptidase [Herbiconiux daphne]|uniref:CPBP family intramembrane metalloprotease n=1 Tax=Herbiconiux daphne TaxID=2970914 RepID=A0ABT2H8J2_9MICO|nr:CPBP family intramembrane glutamic endopeptidase [Herbiconiux daphne]MCS5736276.1 CPBP family intramembrane metalloprotease [Herbiconiux daphne]